MRRMRGAFSLGMSRKTPDNRLIGVVVKLVDIKTDPTQIVKSASGLVF